MPAAFKRVKIQKIECLPLFPGHSPGNFALSESLLLQLTKIRLMEMPLLVLLGGFHMNAIK